MMTLQNLLSKSCIVLVCTKENIILLANTLQVLELTAASGNHITLNRKRARATPPFSARRNKNLLATVAILNNLLKLISVILEEGRVWLETKHSHDNSINGMFKTHYSLFQVINLDSSRSRFFRSIYMKHSLELHLRELQTSNFVNKRLRP